jgi:hypothetical protein
MRELVYLSQRKLNLFQDDSRRRFTVRGEAGIPGVGHVSVESSAADSRLDDVIDHLSGSARWYQEDDLTPGEWVQFEATLGYTVYEAPSPILLFAEVPGARRLLLHGSPEHLSGMAQPQVTEWPRLQMMSHGPAVRHIIATLTGDAMARMLGPVEDPYDPDIAAAMTGYARITTQAPNAVVASPLFVAYAR